MTVDEFRREFDRVRRSGPAELMYCERALREGAAIVVGLNGEFVVMHGGTLVHLAQLRLHPVNDGWLQEIAGCVSIGATTDQAEREAP